MVFDIGIREITFDRIIKSFLVTVYPLNGTIKWLVVYWLMINWYDQYIYPISVSHCDIVMGNPLNHVKRIVLFND